MSSPPRAIPGLDRHRRRVPAALHGLDGRGREVAERVREVIHRHAERPLESGPALGELAGGLGLSQLLQPGVQSKNASAISMPASSHSPICSRVISAWRARPSPSSQRLWPPMQSLTT